MTTHRTNACNDARTIARSLLAATLFGLAAAASAADFQFSGITDSGPLAGTSFSGSFAVDAPAAGFDGDVALSAFTLSFAGQHYGLNASAVASFAGGTLLGLGYQDMDSTDTAVRPTVQLVPGLADFGGLGSAFLQYAGADTDGSGLPATGFGSYSITAVPEPGQWALLLAGLAGAGALSRRRAGVTAAQATR